MDTTLLTPGAFVVMDDLLWTIDRPTPTAGVYRLALARATNEWPVGQVGFGHATRLEAPSWPCTGCHGRGQHENTRERRRCLICGGSGRLPAPVCTGCAQPILEGERHGLVWGADNRPAHRPSECEHRTVTA